MTSATVYKALAEDGSLLYVGASINGPQRISSHKPSKWWEQAQCIELEHLSDHGAALQREAELIRAHQPPFNHQFPIRVPTSAEMAWRMERRKENHQRKREYWATHYYVVADCENCGESVSALPKGVALDEGECPHCGVRRLSGRRHSHAAPVPERRS
jgi:DNA-directed RNA polymerase subunit RPC12/RpoP